MSLARLLFPLEVIAKMPLRREKNQVSETSWNRSIQGKSLANAGFLPYPFKVNVFHSISLPSCITRGQGMKIL
jgi:hypothetical protein